MAKNSAKQFCKNISMGCSLAELSRVCEYEIDVYRNQIGLDDMDEYDRGFYEALRWILDLISPEVKDG